MEQHLYLTTALLCGRSMHQCHAEVHAALRDHASPYRTVARWVQVFRDERAFTADTHRSGHSVSTQTCLSP